MTNNYYDAYDKRIKDGMEALAAEVPVPDVAKAFERHKHRRVHRNRIRSIAAAAALILLLVPAFTGPALAFRGFIQVTISRVLTETSQLFQRKGEETIEFINTTEVKRYESLLELQQDKAARTFIPSGLNEDGFIYAEIIRVQSSELSRFFVEFKHSEKLLHYVVDTASTSARFVDIEDFAVQSLVLDSREVIAFSDDQGFTIFEWLEGDYLFKLSGYVTIDELVEITFASGIFN